MAPRAKKQEDPGNAGVITQRRGEPLLYSALGMYLHLEPLVPDDEERLERACLRIERDFGKTLRHSFADFLGEVVPFDATDFEYVSTAASRLKQTSNGETEAEQIVAAQLGKLTIDDLQVLFKGGLDPEVADPTSVSFWMEIPEVKAGAGYFRAYSVLALTVPLDFELERFRALCTDVATLLRVRWGNAGHTYASWELYDAITAPKARYAHARRHPGCDVGEYTRCVEQFHRRIRSVNWLTFLGESMVDDLTKASAHGLTESAGITIARQDHLTVIQAGAYPEYGDVNRSDIPEKYRKVDAMLRPIRAAEVDGMTWSGAWSDDTITQWLRRFE